MIKRNRDIDLIARTAWGEDYTGGREGMQAVINVIDNRRKIGGWFGSTWRDVILKPYQFSIWNAATTEQYKNDPTFKTYLKRLQNISENDYNFQVAKELAAAAWDGDLPDITNGATHYKLPSAPATWAEGLQPVAYAGHHVFYIA